MERLTHKRENGIKRGYWSPNKKQELVDRLAMYEDQEEKGRWIPISEQLPEDESYIIVSFENATMPDIARYEENDEGGTFYPGDDEKSYSSYGIFVNAWMPLPEPYREEQYMHVEVSEGFRKTIADIVDCCVEGNTNSCTLEVEVRENASLVIDMKFEVKEKKVDELQS